MDHATPDIDAAHFRHVLGHFPTGVTVTSAPGLVATMGATEGWVAYGPGS